MASLIAFSSCAHILHAPKQGLGNITQVARKSNLSDDKTGAWFVYDGECLLCDFAAHACKIKQEHGSIHLVDARKSGDDPLVLEINKLGLDLDDGMVIYASGQFYHGKDALKFMAQYGAGRNVFMVACKSLFWSDIISSLTYPWMRAVRNWLLRRRGIGQIDNLKLKKPD